MTALKRIYTEGAQSIVGRSLEIETTIARGASGSLDGLEERRRAVMERNRARTADRG
jgi:hypothetical protein